MSRIDCHICGGDGLHECGLQHDPDAIVFEPCRNCKGTGEEPWRAAGSRDTGPKPPVQYLGPLKNWSGDLLEELQLARTHENRAYYARVRREAMRPKVMQLAQADMLARAAMCVTAADRAVAAWRAVA
ncbi:hypothetical protein [Rhodanobacter hydrolyticus]|uniref:Transcriptional regulator n=1 Tax=Rhodanobacter hydrolyticus TaxID=2250595 RepID=A0ABW8J723_9GAMM